MLRQEQLRVLTQLDCAAEQIVGPERGLRILELVLCIRRRRQSLRPVNSNVEPVEKVPAATD